MTTAIPLTKGQFAIVDDEDADLAQLKWCAALGKTYANGGQFTARRSVRINKKGYWMLMHRVILSRKMERSLAANELVDHINGDPLDNRRSNLRLATASQNLHNIGRSSANTSGYKGVSWDRRRKKWRARIKKDGKEKHLGLFDTPEEAFEAYCKAGPEYHGEFFNPGEHDATRMS